MFYSLLLIIHIAACLLMILVVLLQTGRGAGLMVFGGGGDSLINTPSGSSFMKKFTAGLAITFACTSLLMTLHSSRSGMSSVTSRVAAPAAQPAP
ncbi:MAG: preprotein translocase subunit SecG, partial [Elusimicrobia bacterium RIFCSPHIGHO2_02_FULL_57_9]